MSKYHNDAADLLMLSRSATSYDSSMLGYLLQKRATSAIWMSESCSNAVLSSSSISIMSKILSTPCAKKEQTALKMFKYML